MNKTVGRSLLLFLPILVGVAFILFIVSLFMTQEQPERASSEPRPVAVFAAPVERQTVSLTVTTQGDVSPRTEIDLVPQVSGRITYVNPNFIEGGFFTAGETLIQIDDADYRLAVTRAQSQVAQAQQLLVREEAEAELAAEEWADLGEGEASALTLRQPQMAQARAGLAAAQATLQEARLGLERTRISAPFDGRVRAKGADLGQYVTPGTRLGQVFATDVVQVRLALTDTDLSMLNIPVAYQAESYEDAPLVTLSAMLAGQRREWSARLVRTDSAIDPQTRVLYAIAQVNDPYGAAAEGGSPLPVGLFVTAEIEGREVTNAFVMPRSSLRGQDMVFVAEAGGRLAIRTVNVITSSADRLVVSDGVTDGDMVITSPVRAASDGMSIRTLTQDGELIEALSYELPEDDAEAADSDDNADGETETDDGSTVASAD